MNKLDTALRLLRLLNERRCIDSRAVADELNVSMRTAQRYLLELSGLPCVILRPGQIFGGRIPLVTGAIFAHRAWGRAWHVPSAAQKPVLVHVPPLQLNPGVQSQSVRQSTPPIGRQAPSPHS